MTIIFLSTLLLAMIVGCNQECPECPDIPFVEATGTWTEPTEGAKVVRYVLDLEMVGENIYSLVEVHGIVDTFYVVDVSTKYDRIRGRVAGIDKFDRVGEFTDWDQGWIIIEK